MVLVNKGDGNAWEAQFAYTFDAPLDMSTEYTIRFKAKSSSASGQLQFQYQNGSTYGSQGGYNTFDVGTSWQTYEHSFTPAYNDANRIILNFGAVGATYTVDDIEANYIKLVEKLHDKMPKAKIYIESLLPVTKNYEKAHKLLSNKRINSLNKRLKKIAGKYDYATYLDVHSEYVTSKGCLSSKISSDGYHLQPDAYERWVKLVKETLKNDK